MPPKPKTIELRFPSLGIVRRGAHERVYSAPAYPTPWACNVRLEDTLTNRLRGGSFTAIDAGDRPSEILYRNRLLTFDDNAILASRAGDHDDTTTSVDVSDVLRPFRFQLSEAGEVGDNVVSLVPHKDAFLLGFTDTETWVLAGDVTTGQLRRVSDQVGIVDEDAWCVNHDTVYFLSSSGLYSVGADGSGLKPLSEDKVPEDLTDVSASTTLTYNHSDRGVYAHITDADVSWFYDTERDGFWPFNTDTTDSHLLIGPLRIGGPTQFGLIQTIHGIMAASSGTVVWRLVPGNTAEEAAANGKLAIEAALAGSDYDEYYVANGAWGEGRSNTAWPRARTPWVVLWLSSSSDWAFESIVLEVVPQFGRIR
jgi:hypothetical protein